MNCNQCGTENKHDAKFCSNCGQELHLTEPATKTASCFHCGFENDQRARFCANCGVELNQDHRLEQKHREFPQSRLKKKGRHIEPKSKYNPTLMGLLIFGGVAVFVLVSNLGGNKTQPGQRVAQPIEAKSADPAVEAKVLAVASKFICSCGTCGELPLETCGCGTAVQERQFIRSSLEAGQSEDKIIAAVNTSFGWMKPQFAVKYDSSSRKNTVTDKLTVAAQKEFSLTPLPAKSPSRIATAFDRVEIFSHFQCPCGQCGIDELKDCSCNHPRGAAEVKAFADQKIAENKYTIAQVIEQIEKQYGGRQF